MLTPEQARDRLPALIEHVVELIGAADLDAPVPSCPDWAVRDLVVHLGNVHRWVVQAMTTGNADDPLPAAAPHDALASWYRGVADDMLDLFAATDPLTPCWTFGMRPRQAAFWFRRQAQEVAIHRWDLGSAAGLDLGIDADLAVDGIDEVATIFFPRQVRSGRTEALTASLALAPEDTDQRWVFSGDGTAPVAEPDATVSGPAAALLLLLWGRTELADERVQLTGSREAAVQVLGSKLVP